MVGVDPGGSGRLPVSGADSPRSRAGDRTGCRARSAERLRRLAARDPAQAPLALVRQWERKLLDEFLFARALEHDAPSVLLQLACDWLRAERIVRRLAET